MYGEIIITIIIGLIPTLVTSLYNYYSGHIYQIIFGIRSKENQKLANLVYPQS